MKNFNEGPWKYWEKSDKTYIIANSINFPIASTYLIGNSGEADARLISTAPELLEALELLVLAHEENDDDSMLFRLERAKKAIKKATGGEFKIGGILNKKYTLKDLFK